MCYLDLLAETFKQKYPFFFFFSKTLLAFPEPPFPLCVAAGPWLQEDRGLFGKRCSPTRPSCILLPKVSQAVDAARAQSGAKCYCFFRIELPELSLILWQPWGGFQGRCHHEEVTPSLLCRGTSTVSRPGHQQLC